MLNGQQAELLVVAIKHLSSERKRAIFTAAMDAGLRVTAVSGPDQVVKEPSRLALQDIAMEDLLGRPQRQLDPQPVRQLLHNKCVCITGAGGSIGSEIARQVAQFNASTVVLVDHSEYALYTIERELIDRGYVQPSQVVPYLVDVSDSRADSENIS